MTKIQWEAFTLIVRALSILLYHLVGEDNQFVLNWNEDLISFVGGKESS